MFNSKSPNEQGKSPFISNKNIQQLQTLAVVALVVFIAAITSFHKIDTSEEGVVTRFGRFSHTLDEGPHFVLPFGIDRVYNIPVTKIHELEFGFRKNNRYFSKNLNVECLNY